MILAIETSTREATLALWDTASNALIEEMRFVTDRAHNAAIFGPLTTLLEGRRDQLQGIVVGRGPGSYGGVRVGISVANGLSLALGIPAIGASSLEAWSTPDDQGTYFVTGDARRNTYFLASIVQRQLTGEPELLSREELLGRLEEPANAGVPICSADANLSELSDSILISYPTARLLAAQWNPSSAEHPPSLEPHYLRAPYITVPKTTTARQ